MIYDLLGNAVDSVYDVDGQQIFEAFDIDNNELINHSLTLLNSQQIATGQSPQGMATYDGYIFQFFSTINKLKIFRESDYSLVQEIPCAFIGHGNNLQFGVEEQQSGFPLLYASDSDSADARYIYVVQVDLSSASLVDTITLPSAVGNFPNGVIDFANRKIYTAGYTANSVYSKSGKYVFCVLSLDDPSSVIDSWQLDYLGVMNGLLWNGKNIILNANTYDGLEVKFYFINPKNKSVSTVLSFSKEDDSEYQGMSLKQGWILVSKWIYKTINNVRSLFYEFYKLE